MGVNCSVFLGTDLWFCHRAASGQVVGSGQCGPCLDIFWLGATSYMLLFGIVWCCIVLHGNNKYCMVMAGIVWY